MFIMDNVTLDMFFKHNYLKSNNKLTNIYPCHYGST